MSIPDVNLQAPRAIALAIPEAGIEPPRSPVAPHSPVARERVIKPLTIDSAFSDLTARITELAVFQILTTVFFLPTTSGGYGQILKAHGGSFEIAFDAYLRANTSPVGFWLIKGIKPIITSCLSVVFNNSFSQVKNFSKEELRSLIRSDEKQLHLIRLIKSFINVAIDLNHQKLTLDREDENTFKRACDLQHDQFLTELNRDLPQDADQPASIRAKKLVNEFYQELAHELLEAFHPRFDFKIEAKFRNALAAIEAKIAGLEGSPSSAAKIKKFFYTVYRNFIAFLLNHVVAPAGQFKNAVFKDFSHLFDRLLAFILESSISAFLELLKDQRGFSLDIYRGINSLLSTPPTPPTAEEAAALPLPVAVDTPISLELKEIVGNLMRFFKDAPTAETSLGSLATGLIDHVVGYGETQIKQTVVSIYRTLMSPANLEQTQTQALTVFAKIIKGCQSGVEEVGSNPPANEEYMREQEALKTEIRRETDQIGDHISEKAHTVISDFLAPSEAAATAGAAPSSFWSGAFSRASSAVGMVARSTRHVVSFASRVAYGRTPTELIGHDYATKKLVYVKDALLDPRTVRTVTNVAIPLVTHYIRRQTTVA
jgi:hypothetical protein